MSESEIIQKLIAGDERSFRELIEKEQQKIFSICIGFVENKEEAEDLTQEVFIEVFRSIKNFKGNSTLSTWMYRIAVNKSLNAVQKKKSQGFVVSIQTILGLKSSYENPQQKLINKEKSSLLHKAIEELPENQRTAFTLARFDDLSYKEISEIMETSVSSVESLIFRAKASLQKKLVSAR